MARERLPGDYCGELDLPRHNSQIPKDAMQYYVPIPGRGIWLSLAEYEELRKLYSSNGGISAQELEKNQSNPLENSKYHRLSENPLPFGGYNHELACDPNTSTQIINDLKEMGYVEDNPTRPRYPDTNWRYRISKNRGDGE